MPYLAVNYLINLDDRIDISMPCQYLLKTVLDAGLQPACNAMKE